MSDHCVQSKFEPVQAVSNSETSPVSAYSPICHRTRQQIKGKLCANDCFDPEISNAVQELVSEVSVTTPLKHTSVVASVHSPSTIIEIGELPCSSQSTIVVVENEPSTIVQIEDVQCDAVSLTPPPCVYPFCDLDSPVMPSATFQFDIRGDDISQSVPLPLSRVTPTETVEEKRRCVTSELAHDSVVDEVTLFPSEVQTALLSAGGLENHLYAVHRINLDNHEHTPIGTDLLPLSDVLPPPELLAMGPTTGPPKCAPFSQASPAKTWASVVRKPAASTTQPWAGKPIHSQTAVFTTPRRPWSSGGPVKSSLHAASPLKRKVLPCPRCDFTFRTLKSRDKHLVVHSLEDEFSRLHGIVSSSNNADFDDFVLPKSPHPQSLPKQSKSLAVQDLATTSSTHQAYSSAPATAASLPLICDFCDKRGFPSRKALKYHLFRLHGQPMRKASQQPHSSTFSHDQGSTSPACAISTTQSVVRQDAKLELSFPINGKIACPESGCNASFVSGMWNTMKGSLIAFPSQFVNSGVTFVTLIFRVNLETTHALRMAVTLS
ncbi:hypothetical protein CDAR_27061 [Caerostris darwini]|uniref:C2H2-type domain-containing protein n=1 Tax=Caerostris darwini TaxID=1538125 RepID=A0AAV4TG79_9ARAC|nr:hypothetical protein CDAR_27061 [Caerostris darwini]